MIIKSALIYLAFLCFAYFVFRVLIKRDYKKLQKLSTSSYLLEILVFAVHANLFYVAIPTKWPNIPSLPDSVELKIIAAIIFGVGSIILLFSWFGLGTKTSLGMDKNKLNTGGIYQYSRNPQLLGYGLMLSSFAILLFSWSSIIWLVLYVVTAAFMIQSEEEFLRSKYSEEYTRYCAKVPRILKLSRGKKSF
jgi:protein-S-isoprenylcysteine O-methyltransferase Ste14